MADTDLRDEDWDDDDVLISYEDAGIVKGRLEEEARQLDREQTTAWYARQVQRRQA